MGELILIDNYVDVNTLNILIVQVFKSMGQ